MAGISIKIIIKFQIKKFNLSISTFFTINLVGNLSAKFFH